MNDINWWSKPDVKRQVLKYDEKFCRETMTQHQGEFMADIKIFREWSWFRRNADDFTLWENGAFVSSFQWIDENKTRWKHHAAAIGTL